MNVERSEAFDRDVERQFRWYLLETDLDATDALTLATRFADAVDAALERLETSPGIGRPRFDNFPDLREVRSWAIPKPFQRFLIFYRTQDETLYAERLLEGHSRLAAEY